MAVNEHLSERFRSELRVTPTVSESLPGQEDGHWLSGPPPMWRWRRAMDVSERVTWEDCPNCGRPAAVGWLDEFPIEFDFTGGCLLSLQQIRALATGRRPVT
jgi:hypothetical protein